MRVFQAILGVATVASLAAVPAFAGPAGQRGGPHARPAGAPAAPHAPAPKTTTTTTTTKPTTTKAATPKSKTTTTAPTTVASPVISPVAQKIATHPQLASRVRALLPAGMTLNGAAAGFKNQGQFIAALHVSRNLHIPFAQLKTEMTGPHQRSLGQAIHALRPAGDATKAQHQAETEAHEDLQTANVAPAKAKHDKHAATKPRGDHQ